MHFPIELSCSYRDKNGSFVEHSVSDVSKPPYSPPPSLSESLSERAARRDRSNQIGATGAAHFAGNLGRLATLQLLDLT
jgi:hypothetical protein